MNDRGAQITGDAARVYESFFVPALFAEWAEPLCRAARLRWGDRVLDVACGTGALTREVVRVAGPTVVGLDINPGMLAVAREVVPGASFQLGRAEALPFEAESFDAILSQFGLMFFEDGPGALAEMHRVLRRGGRMAVAVWGPLEDTPGYAATVRLLDRLFGPAVSEELRAPYRLGDPAALLALFDEARLAGVKLETSTGTVRFRSIADWVRTDIDGWTLAGRLDEDQFNLLLREAQNELVAYESDGGVSFAAPAHIATLTKG